ncbi:MAG TPA: Gfo/Idh/MocA family oxidoreductase [Armatimonadetes bacterium]|nr:Gfo/Idh/MocA family oxidoreductase [Armatimonadota bacterium]
MDKLRVAVIGCGNISRAHLNGWLAYPRAEVVYCVDIDEPRAREKAETVGCRWHTDYRAVLDEVDAVDICTPPHLHAEMTIEAARRGKHVLCEKVMALTLEEAEAMIQATEEAGVVFMVAFVLRYRPEFQKLHQICTSGRLGRIFQAYCQTSMFLGTVAPWRTDPEKFPMGAFLSHGCHYVDQLIWNIGRITHAAVMSNNFTFGECIVGDDTSVAIFRHLNGAVSAYVESWAVRYPLTRLLFDAYGTEGSVRLQYHGDGTRTLDVWDAQGQERVFTFDPRSQEHLDAFGGVKDMQGQIAHFADCVLEGRQPLTHGREGIKAMQVILAACWGEETKRLVDVDAFVAACKWGQ